ncbi:unnamed protein product [Urochloa decumbens]|uniref:Uncharacterized protein n=1 Tax=Urochloa decumbens TaxID=240449 RepID=A0ABC9A472_9POAL
MDLELERLGGGLDDGPGQQVVARVACGAVCSDLPLGGAGSEHVDLPHLDVGVDELVEEGGLVEREPLHERPRGGVGEQVLVGGEEPLPVEQVHVVLVVERVGRPDVVAGGVDGALGRAGVLELPREPLVQGGVLRREEAVLEGAAVRDADGVAAGERHEVGGVQLDLVQEGQQRGDRGARRRERAQDDRVRRRGQPVATAQGHLVRRAAAQGDGVARGERDDVGAGDDAAAAGLLEAVADLVDGLERGGSERLVGDGLLLAGLAGRGVEQDGGVAALDEAVVEVQPDERRGEAHVALHGRRQVLPHDMMPSALGQLFL